MNDLYDQSSPNELLDFSNRYVATSCYMLHCLEPDHIHAQLNPAQDPGVIIKSHLQPPILFLYALSFSLLCCCCLLLLL